MDGSFKINMIKKTTKNQAKLKAINLNLMVDEEQ